MLCLYPITLQSGSTVACGQCLNCRINHKLRWMGRMALEHKYAHPGTPGTFLTLTYDDEHLPETGSLVRGHLKVFIDLLKRHLSPRVRYFAVGEYGSIGLRPHYHVIHFDGSTHPAMEAIYKKCWKHGFIQVGTAKGAAFDYVCGYITKKMDQKHEQRIEDEGLVPEYFSCSKKPPLGTSGLRALADMFTTSQGAEAIAEYGFPRGFHCAGRYYPFFPKDRDRIIDQCGYDERIDQIPYVPKYWDDPLRSWWSDLDNQDLIVKASREGWSPKKLMDRITTRSIERNAAKEEIRKEQARARAAKYRRRQKYAALKALD